MTLNSGERECSPLCIYGELYKNIIGIFNITHRQYNNVKKCSITL